MNAERRLIEYCQWLQEPGLNCLPASSGALARLADEGKDSRRHRGDALRRGIRGRRGPGSREIRSKETGGVRMEIVVHDGDSVACPPDGGMGAMVDRMFYAIQKDNRCKEIAAIVGAMPADHLTIVQCTYIGHWRDVPRSSRAAAGILGVSHATYWRRKQRLLDWLAEKLDISEHRKAA